MQMQNPAPLPSPRSGQDDRTIKGLLALAMLSGLCLLCFGLFITFTVTQAQAVNGGGAPAYAAPLLMVLIAGCAAGLAGLLLLVRGRPRVRATARAWLVAAAILLCFAPVHVLDETRDVTAYTIIAALGGLMLALRPRSRSRGLADENLAQPVVWPWVVLCALPWVLRGAFGSLLDVALAGVVALCMGFVLARLDALFLRPVFVVRSGRMNTLLHGAALSGLALLLSRAFGFTNHVILLMAVLPVLGPALARVSQHTSQGAASPVGFFAAGAAFAPLAFVDAKEFNMMLGFDDMPGLIFVTAFIAFCVNMIISATILEPKVLGRARLLPRVLMGGLATALAAVAWFFVGNPGLYNDRIFVILKDKAELAPALALPTTLARHQRIYELMTAQATSSQSALRSQLQAYGIGTKPFYLVNAIEVDSPYEGGALLRLWLQSLPEVDRVLSSPRHKPLGRSARGLPFVQSSSADDIADSVPSITWGLQKIEAPRVWQELNVRGAGVVVGNTDSGVDGAHFALQEGYRGRDGTDDFNWFDPWGGEPKPVDYSRHGTHTLGTILGKNRIGVAPDAQWIGCVNLARNLGNAGDYLACMQFMFAPHPQSGDPFTQGKPELGANIVNNSWGCPPVEGCDAGVFEDALHALSAAGIFMAASAGNSGPQCSSIDSPPAIYADAFTVGAMDEDGNIADFSSRGPVFVDGSNRAKPDVVAPGVKVVSSVPHQRYESYQGTSMAGPHVAGVVALMWSANPKLAGNVARTQQILRETARPFAGRVEISCGSSGDSNQSNIYGYGVLNAYEAVQQALREK